MIAAVVVCPSPPMLLPEYVGIADPAGPLRERCVAALRETLAGAPPWDALVVVTGREPVPRTSRPPLGVRIGRLLAERAGWNGPIGEVVVPFDADAEAVARAGASLAGRPGRVLALVVADGSARRGEKAPGHLDERAFAFDESLVRALGEADRRALLELDAGLAGELLASGRAALQVVAHAVLGVPHLRGRLLWSGDPHGVLYAVATWQVDR